MATTSKRSSAKETLLDAAAEIVSTQGVHELTLEGVAALAGVTKGGLIYHYKTKDELLAALIQRMIEELERRNEAHSAGRGDTTRSLLTAMVDETLEMPPQEKQLLANLLAAASTHAHLLGPVQALNERIYGGLAKSGPHAGLAVTIALALDGLLFFELLNLHRFSKRQRDAIRKAMLTLIQTVD
jgi:AcrR family transcriptional regulator